MLIPVNIREAGMWESIRPKLQEVKDMRGGSWLPEDIFSACSRSEAFVFVGEHGLVVVKPMIDDFSGEHFLLVWLAYGEGGECIDTYQADLIEIAKSAGCSKLQFWRRPKLDVSAKGWRKQYTIYELEV
jgi:hypothetical protein